MRDLAAEERFEEATLARDRLRALAEALARARTDGWLLGTRELRLADTHGRPIVLRGGALGGDTLGGGPIGAPCPRERADELSAVRSWLGRNPVRLVGADPPLAEPIGGGAHLHRLLGTLRGADRRDEAGPSARAS